jgi:hypothetical protein
MLSKERNHIPYTGNDSLEIWFGLADKVVKHQMTTLPNPLTGIEEPIRDEAIHKYHLFQQNTADFQKRRHTIHPQLLQHSGIHHHL